MEFSGSAQAIKFIFSFQRVESLILTLVMVTYLQVFFHLESNEARKLIASLSFGDRLPNIS